MSSAEQDRIAEREPESRRPPVAVKPNRPLPKPTASRVARTPAIIVTIVIGAVVGLSLWYLVQPQPLIIQGEADATRIDGHTMVAAKAVGKQMFLEFDNDLWLRIHLGIYGAWDFAGDISIDPTIASANGRMGQTQQKGTATPAGAILDEAGENSLHSIGAPRRSSSGTMSAAFPSTATDSGRRAAFASSARRSASSRESAFTSQYRCSTRRSHC